MTRRTAVKVLAAALAVAILVLSFIALRDVAIHHGVPASIAWAVPPGVAVAAIAVLYVLAWLWPSSNGKR